MALQSEVSSVLVSFGMECTAPGGCWGTKVPFFVEVVLCRVAGSFLEVRLHIVLLCFPFSLEGVSQLDGVDVTRGKWCCSLL